MLTRLRIPVALGCLLLPRLAQAAPTYSLTPIVASNPEDAVYAVSINNRGEVAGSVGRRSADGTETYVPFFWNGTGPVRELPVPAGSGEYLYQTPINNRGEILATAGNNSVIWSPDGTLRTVAAPPGHLPASVGLNDAGTISGAGFRQHADGSAEFLPGFSGGPLNQSGAAPGSLGDGLVVWEPDGTVRPLSTAGVVYAQVHDINDAGWAAGMIFSAEGDTTNVALWRPDGTLLVATNAARENDGSVAYGINNRNEVVGYGFKHPLYWSEADGAVDLQTRLDASGAGWTLSSASDINDAGQIVATAFRTGDATYQGYSVLLTPVPEPTGALAGVAVLAVMATRRRRS
jgi:hypothetical protein